MDKKTKKIISELKSGKGIAPSKKKYAKELKKIAVNLEAIIKGLEAK